MTKETKENRTAKFISALLIILIMTSAVLFPTPKKAEAIVLNFDWVNSILHGIGNAFTGTTASATTTGTALQIQNAAKAITTQILKTVASRLIQAMTVSTVNWINSGFHGSPLFLQNPDSFFRDVAKSSVETIINQFGYDSRQFPFGKAFALNVINSYKSTLDRNAAYSLSNVINDPNLLYNYQNNFNVGGWNGFLLNTQYPQNNYLGFQQLATEQLARQLVGTVQSPAQRVQSLLQQGQGFLSPQICQTNKNYNTSFNEFNAPKFDKAKWESDYAKTDAIPTCENNTGSLRNDGGVCEDYVAWQARHDTALVAAQAKFNDPKGTTFCPPQTNGAPGLINTTPGGVVGKHVEDAIASSQARAIFGEALGNGISAVVNALADHFLGNEGLLGLASTKNPAPQTDTFTYNGQTLGSPAVTGTNDTWNTGPDQEIILADFKKSVDDAIANTQKELTLMDNTYATPTNDPTHPGITQVLGQIWPAARLLDICQPGPDVGWEDRTDQEMQRNNVKLGNDKDSGNQSAASALVTKDLQFAVNMFKDWIKNKMLLVLPNSALYIGAVNDVHVLSQQSDELSNAKRLKTQALARLEAIKLGGPGLTGLDNITVQPDPGSDQEKTLVSLWKQLQATTDNVSTSTSVTNTQDELDKVREQLANLKKLVPACEAERKASGWTIPNYATGSARDTLLVPPQSSSSGSAPSGTINGLKTNSEQALFCDLPIQGGYTHGAFKAHEPVLYPDLPMVNGDKVMRWEGAFGIKHYSVGISLSCNIIYKANVLDYKGNLPGLTTIKESAPLPDDTDASSLGSCSYPADGTNAASTDTGVSKEDCDANGGDWTPPDNQ